MGSRLEHPVVAPHQPRGYVSKEIKLAEGHELDFSSNGRNRGEYWLFKSAISAWNCNRSPKPLPVALLQKSLIRVLHWRPNCLSKNSCASPSQPWSI